jgi:hypothetical protein
MQTKECLFSFFLYITNRLGVIIFKPVWLGFSGFGSVFSVLARFFCGLARFFRFGSVFFRFFVGFGSVRFFWFFAYKTEPAGFFKNLIGFFFGSVFSVFFSVFSV